MMGEISYDLIDEDDMDFDEGCYRMNDGDWCVFIINKRPVNAVEIIPSYWDTGVSGVVIHVPQSARINRTLTESLLADWLGLEGWKMVRGPDSMDLR